MSEEIKELTDEEAMKILREFATTCYDKGVKDALIGVSVGAICGVVIAGGSKLSICGKTKRKPRNKLKSLILL